MAKRKPLTRKQKYIRRQVREKGLTEGQAAYRWRLKENLAKKKTVREARGHAAPDSRAKRVERPTQVQRSAVARSLGPKYNNRFAIREHRNKTGTIGGKLQLVYDFAGLARRTKRNRFYRDVVPQVAAWDSDVSADTGETSRRLIVFRFVLDEKRKKYRFGSEWSAAGAGLSVMIERFEFFNNEDDLEILSLAVTEFA